MSRPRSARAFTAWVCTNEGRRSSQSDWRQYAEHVTATDLVMKSRNKKELISIQLYRALDAIVETGSMTNAAAPLHLTQAAISAQIKKLEDLLGGAVFERSGSGHVL